MCKKKGCIVMLSVMLIVDQNADSVPVQILKQAGEYHRQRVLREQMSSKDCLPFYREATSRSVEKAREAVSGINKEGGSNV